MSEISEHKQEHNRLDEHSLGIAGRTARQFINSPVTPLLMFAFLALGLLGLMFTPRQEDPKISVPMVDIFVRYPGASADQVSSLVTEPLERLMSEIPGVRHVYSATERGTSVVTVRFKVGESIGASIVKVHDKLQSNLDKIPPGVSLPLVKPVGIDDVPIVTITLWSKAEQGGVDDGTLRTLAVDVLQRLKEVPNTGNVFVVGGRADQIRVEVQPEKLSGYGISLAQVAQTIRTANAEEKTGYIEGSNSSFSVYSGAFLRTSDEVSRLVIGVYDGAPVYLRDVARVFHYPEETREIASYYTGVANPAGLHQADGEAAVTIAIAKKIDTNGVTVAEDVIRKLNSLKGRIIPDNIHVKITRNYGETANHKINELLRALFEAAVAVSILCLVAMGLRAASVVIVIIPIVILVTIWSALVLDYTIDRVSLFALVFSIGILVDDATVVVENIFRRWLSEGETKLTTAIDAVREVGNPTILATFTIIAALLPMGFVSGLMGPYMRPIPVLGSSSMFFSLIAAFVFAPWLAMRVRPRLKALEKAEKREQRFRDWVGRFYRPCMMPLCTNKTWGWVFLLSLIGLTLFACSMFYFKWVTVKLLPFDNKPDFDVVINMPAGTALPVTANVANSLASVLRRIPEVTSLQSYSGTASPFNFNGMVRHYYLRKKSWQADIQVILLSKYKRKRGSHAIAVSARHLLNKYINETPYLKQSGIRVQVVEMPPGPPVLQTLVAEIYGPDDATRRKVASDMTRMFDKAKDVVDVDNYMEAPHKYWRFEIDTDKAVRYGISVDTINQNLAMAMGGYKLGDIKREGVREPTYIVIQVPLGIRSQVSSLYSMPIMASNGINIPLGELGHFVLADEDPVIYHKDLRPMEYVTAEMEGKLGAPLYGINAVEDELAKYVTPDGVHMSGLTLGGTIGRYGPPPDNGHSGFEWTGEWTVTYETFRDMGAAFMAALVLIYGLIVWEFKNFALAGLIMAPIPLTLIGIIPGHLITGSEFTATSMIGFIALAGIIVRNSILLVEFVKHEVVQGRDIVDAVIMAGQIRMRPILITAGALMAGAFMLFSDPIFQGMAVSLFFGVFVATILTLVVIPIGCISARKQFYLLAGIDMPETVPSCPLAAKMPLWLVIWGKLISVVTWLFYILRAIYFMLVMAFNSLMKRFRRGDDGVPGGGGGPNTPTPPPSGGDETGMNTSAAETTAEIQPDNTSTAPKTTQTRTAKTTTKKRARKKTSRQATRTVEIEQAVTEPQSKKETQDVSSVPAKPQATRTSKKRRGIRLKKI